MAAAMSVVFCDRGASFISSCSAIRVLDQWRARSAGVRSLTLGSAVITDPQITPVDATNGTAVAVHTVDVLAGVVIGGWRVEQRGAVHGADTEVTALVLVGHALILSQKGPPRQESGAGRSPVSPGLDQVEDPAE